MNLEAEKEALEKIFDIYSDRIDTIPDELFNKTPPGGGWSFAEVYSHILQFSLNDFDIVEKCAINAYRPTSKGLSMAGRYVMFLGHIPDLKNQAPGEKAARMPALKISKAEAYNSLNLCRRRMYELIPLILIASPTSRYKHSSLGMLNSYQWYKFIRMHAQHHLKQLQRIEDEFKKNQKIPPLIPHLKSTLNP